MSNIEKLKTMKTVFVYDEDGFYCGTHIAQLNPRNKSSWLMPPMRMVFSSKLKIPGTPNLDGTKYLIRRLQRTF